MRFLRFITLATVAILCGCQGKNSSKTNTGFQLSKYDGTYITTTNAQGVIAVVQVKYVASLGESAIFGYTVAKQADAQTVADSGMPYLDTGNITTGIVRGTLVYADSTPHSGNLTFSMQIKPNGTKSWSSIETDTGPGYFNTATGALIDTVPSTSTTSSTWTLYTAK
jgi:hypothetical protein